MSRIGLCPAHPLRLNFARIRKTPFGGAFKKALCFTTMWLARAKPLYVLQPHKKASAWAESRNPCLSSPTIYYFNGKKIFTNCIQTRIHGLQKRPILPKRTGKNCLDALRPGIGMRLSSDIPVSKKLVCRQKRLKCCSSSKSMTLQMLFLILERRFAAEKKDKVVTFDELGVDALFIDEADEFKNLFIATSLSRISGLGNLQGADKAFDLFVKARYLQQQHHGRGVYFATGTPVANTIAEIYTMQRYLQYDEMKARGIHHFDAWASIFGQVTTGWELDATGVNYRLNSRFSKFQNVPELTAPYRSFADVVTKEDLQRQAAERGLRFPLPKIKGGKPANIVVDRSEQQAKFMGVQAPVLDDDGIPMRREDGSVILDWAPGSIIDRMERLPSDPHIDNPLKITNDARKAGLDFRLIDPTAPDFKGSKINVAVNEMVRIWQHWRDKRGAQLVFCDLSTPKSSNSAPVPNIQENRDTAYDEGEETALSMDEISPPSFRSIQRL